MSSLSGNMTEPGSTTPAAPTLRMKVVTIRNPGADFNYSPFLNRGDHDQNAVPANEEPGPSFGISNHADFSGEVQVSSNSTAAGNMDTPISNMLRSVPTYTRNDTINHVTGNVPTTITQQPTNLSVSGSVAEMISPQADNSFMSANAPAMISHHESPVLPNATFHTIANTSVNSTAPPANVSTMVSNQSGQQNSQILPVGGFGGSANSANSTVTSGNTSAVNFHHGSPAVTNGSINNTIVPGNQPTVNPYRVVVAAPTRGILPWSVREISAVNTHTSAASMGVGSSVGVARAPTVVRGSPVVKRGPGRPRKIETTGVTCGMCSRRTADMATRCQPSKHYFCSGCIIPIVNRLGSCPAALCGQAVQELDSIFG